MTSGSQQALAIAARVLLDPGDEVWVEEPGYSGARDALAIAGARADPGAGRRGRPGRGGRHRAQPAGAGRLRHPVASISARERP